MTPLSGISLGSFPAASAGSAGQTQIDATSANMQVLATNLVAAVAKVNELITEVESLAETVDGQADEIADLTAANLALTARVEALESLE